MSSAFYIGAALLSAIAIYMAFRNRQAVGGSVLNSTFIRKNGLFLSSYLFLTVALWIVFMIVMPQLYMVDFSFRHNLPLADVGGPKDVHTLKNYEYLIFGRQTDEEFFNWLHLTVFLKTMLASIFVTLLDLAICYPIAYYMAQVAKGGKARLIVLALIVPFWVNEILRAFAFRILFGSGGVINTLLISLGIWDEPFDFLRADIGLYAGLSYAYILLMIFPIYNAIESLDHNQIDAARDLGSPWWRIHWRIVIPHAKPGIASACTMVFMLSAGALAAPQILGGPSSLWFTQVIYQWFNTGGNWPQGSAYAFVLLIACIAFVMTVMKLFKVSLGEITK
jgi:spermidine/putrescine transport system permease protein